MRTTYFIGFQAVCDTSSTEVYEENAGQVIHMLQSIFQDESCVAQLIKSAAVEAVSMDVRASDCNSEGVYIEAVLDIDAEKRVMLDKSKLSLLVKSNAHCPILKIEKRMIDGEKH